MQFLKSKLHQLYLNESIRRVFHTFWQSFSATLLLSAGDLAGMPKLSIAYKLLVSAVSAGLAAVKALYLNKKG